MTQEIKEWTVTLSAQRLDNTGTKRKLFVRPLTSDNPSKCGLQTCIESHGRMNGTRTLPRMRLDLSKVDIYIRREHKTFLRFARAKKYISKFRYITPNRLPQGFWYTVEWSSVQRALELHDFGGSFRRRVQTFYRKRIQKAQFVTMVMLQNGLNQAEEWGKGVRFLHSFFFNCRTYVQQNSPKWRCQGSLALWWWGKTRPIRSRHRFALICLL